MRLFSEYGMIEVDDAALSPHGPLAPDPEQVRAAEARWNAPPPDYVTVRTTVGPVRPVPKAHLTFIRQCVAAVGLELGNRYRLDVHALWPILSGAAATQRGDGRGDRPSCGAPSKRSRPARR